MTVVHDAELQRPQVLVIDDEVAMVRSLELLLRSHATIHKAYSVPEAEQLFQAGKKIDCVITDVTMPEASGLTILDYLRRKGEEIPVIVMTAYSSVPQAVDAIQRGAFEYIVKPFENTDMLSAVKKAIAKKGLAYGESKSLPDGWICNSQAMKEFVVTAERASESQCVLICGETGVGKGRAARWMHEKSSRSKKDFLVIDGRAHVDDAKDLVATCPRGGTLFVAEVFSLPRKLQDQLIEVLALGKISVIASCSVTPSLQSVPEFREDLFDRLMSVTIRFPNLAERAEDFEALVYRIVNGIAERWSLTQLRLDASALAKLKSGAFPGNVRELEKVLERAALQARTGLISEANIDLSGSELKDLLPFSIPLENGWNRLEALRQGLEKELMVRALEKYPNTSNTEIAQILGTTRRVLELRMKEYGIRET